MSKTIKSTQISVYIIDKHVLMRQILVSMLKQIPGIKVAGSAHSMPEKSLSLSIEQHNPDVIMLGIDELNSAEMDLFRFLRKNYKSLPVVLLTPLNREGAKIAISGLKQGAVDYITKPDCKQGLILASRHFKKRVIPIMKGITELNSSRISQSSSIFEGKLEETVVTSGSYLLSPENIDVLIISGCMGGVQSLLKIISRIPEKFPVPVVIVQHMPKIYTRELAAQLDLLSPLNVREAKDNSPLLPGQVYIAPGGNHIVMKNDESRKKLYIHKGPREHKSRPSIDVLLRSAVQVYGNRVLSLFLSGGGDDGVYGAQLVKNAGGFVIIESKESALMWDTPGKISLSLSGVKSIHAEKIVPEIIKLIHPVQDSETTRHEFIKMDSDNLYEENGLL